MRRRQPRHRGPRIRATRATVHEPPTPSQATQRRDVGDEMYEALWEADDDREEYMRPVGAVQRMRDARLTQIVQSAPNSTSNASTAATVAPTFNVEVEQSPGAFTPTRVSEQSPGASTPTRAGSSSIIKRLFSHKKRAKTQKQSHVISNDAVLALDQSATSENERNESLAVLDGATSGADVLTSTSDRSGPAARNGAQALAENNYSIEQPTATAARTAVDSTPAARTAVDSTPAARTAATAGQSQVYTNTQAVSSFTQALSDNATPPVDVNQNYALHSQQSRDTVTSSLTADDDVINLDVADYINYSPTEATPGGGLASCDEQAVAAAQQVNGAEWDVQPPPPSGAPPSYLPKHLLDQGANVQLKRKQVEEVISQQKRVDGVKVAVRKNQCFQKIAFVQCFDRIW